MRSATLLAVLVAATPLAHAGPGPDAKALIEELPRRDPDKGHPVFAFTNDAVYPRGAKQHGNQPNFMGSGVSIKNLVVAGAGDGKTAWFAADVKGVPDPDECAPEPCGPNRQPPLHVTGLVEKAGPDERGGQRRPGSTWSWVAWHITEPVPPQHQQHLLQRKVLPDPLTRSIEGAEGVVALFETTITESKTLAGTVSDRKDVVLYGSEGAERWVGGAKVKAQLQKWQLGFIVRDGVQAGLTASKNVAWVAANVDARSIKRPLDKPTHYRVLFVYELVADKWKVVQLHFSVDRNT